MWIKAFFYKLLKTVLNSVMGSGLFRRSSEIRGYFDFQIPCSREVILRECGTKEPYYFLFIGKMKFPSKKKMESSGIRF